jgi:hypothetical protein
MCVHYLMMMRWGVLLVSFMWVGFVCCCLCKNADFMNLWHSVLVFWTNILHILMKMGVMQLVFKVHYKDFLQDMNLLMKECEGKGKYHVFSLSEEIC